MKKPKKGTPAHMQLAYAAEAEAKKMARELTGSEGLFELFLADAYRRCAGLPPVDYAASSAAGESQK